MVRPREHALPALLAALLLGATPALADRFEGTITRDGQPVVGALVTLAIDGGQIQETVYSDAAGRYRLDTMRSGKASLRVRAPHLADAERAVALDGAGERIDFVLAPHADARAASDALSASAHAAKVKIASETSNVMYRSQCFFCHQIGNAWTRREKTQGEWEAAIARMEAYAALLTGSTRRDILKALPEAFNGKPIEDRQRHDSAPELATALLTEIRLGDASSFMHDAELGSDGRFYAVDMANDAIAITDFASGRSESFTMPHEGRPKFGRFSGGSMPLAAFNAWHGPHSIVEGPDKRFYTTNALSAELGIFDPQTKSYEFVPLGNGALYPHTLRFDKDGILWFSISLSNQLGRYDPKTKAVQIIALPSGGFWQWLTDQLVNWLIWLASFFPGSDLHITLSHHGWSGQGDRIFNLPYGLDIHPLDGSIWYSKLYADKIGRYDPKTGAITEYATPLRGPRRMRFAADGTLWIPAYGGSGLMAFDTKAEKFTSLPLPVLGEGEFETPYALNVHPKTQEVWITSNLSDRLFRYQPKEKRWISYPVATRTSYMRDIVFAPDGRVCSMNANLPAGAVEGGHQQIVCLQPDTRRMP